ncbi:hypothetical protein KCP76_08180 [Salmonella enterica subsp. enterica serovar Weltevreden]|nr:hypothetical protein KCP76_08180 [Salmonella enterica subsp. enterica serovar Weltevreden]
MDFYAANVARWRSPILRRPRIRGIASHSPVKPSSVVTENSFQPQRNGDVLPDIRVGSARQR